jgi:hypothetical protein
MATYIWTYHCVDPDLIWDSKAPDLVDEAIDAVPTQAWSTRDAARAAAERECELQWRESVEGDEEAEPFVPLAWEPIETPQDVPAELTWEEGSELHAANESLGIHFYVDRIELDPPLTEGERALVA